MLRKRALILIQLGKESFCCLHVALDAHCAKYAPAPDHRKRRIHGLQLLAGRGLILVIPASHGLLCPQGRNGCAVIFIHIKNIQQLFSLHINIICKIHHPAEHTVIVYDP